MTVLNLVLNVVLIRGLGPDPRVRHRRRGDGDGDRLGPGRRLYALWKLWRGGWVVSFPARPRLRSRLDDHQVAVPVRPADRHSGHRDEHRRRVHARVHRLAGAERGGAGGVRGVVHAALLADHLDVGRTDGRGRGGRRPEPRRGPSRTAPNEAVHVAARFGLAGAAFIGCFFLFFPRQLLAVFGMNEPGGRRDRRAAAARAQRLRAASSPSRSPTPAACRARATPRARSTSRSSRRSSCRSASAS